MIWKYKWQISALYEPHEHTADHKFLEEIHNKHAIVRTSSVVLLFHDDVIKWNIFRVTGPLCGEFTGDRWISLIKASDAELRYFLWYAPE